MNEKKTKLVQMKSKGETMSHDEGNSQSGFALAQTHGGVELTMKLEVAKDEA